MNKMKIGILPFPLTSHFTVEIVRQIKAIPDEEMGYTEADIAWYERAIENLNYMLNLKDTSEFEVKEMLKSKKECEEIIATGKRIPPKSQ